MSLLAEAQQIGLLSPEDAPNEFDQLIDTLRSVLEWQPQTPPYQEETTLRDLQDRREQLTDHARTLGREIEAAKAFALRQAGFSHEVVEQRNRLVSINLYSNDVEAHTCPLCNQQLASPTPTASNVLQSLAEIERQMETVARQRPRLDAYISGREERLSQARQALTENRAAIEAVVTQQELLQRHRNRQAAQARTVGRISLFIESLRQGDDEDGGLKDRLAKALSRIDELTGELDDEAIEDRLDAALRMISDQMSEWAKKLELEFSECPLELDLAHLTVVAFRENGKVRLSDMGSAENWMGYHLVTHLALHKWFVEKQRPVPGFLMLDQPTQVYFPGDPPTDGSLDTLNDEDRQKVKHIFKFLFDVVASLAPNFQIIITDHANLREQWFQKAVIQRWCAGRVAAACRRQGRTPPPGRPRTVPAVAGTRRSRGDVPGQPGAAELGTIAGCQNVGRSPTYRGPESGAVGRRGGRDAGPVGRGGARAGQGSGCRASSGAPRPAAPLP